MFFIFINSVYNESMKITKKLYHTLYLALAAQKVGHVSAHDLSQVTAIYPEIIAEAFSLFNPLITLDLHENLKPLLSELKVYLIEQKVGMKTQDKHIKADPLEGLTLTGYMYDTMTIGGLLDRNQDLSLKQLKQLKKLIIKTIKEKSK